MLTLPTLVRDRQREVPWAPGLSVVEGPQTQNPRSLVGVGEVPPAQALLAVDLWQGLPSLSFILFSGKWARSFLLEGSLGGWGPVLGQS